MNTIITTIIATGAIGLLAAIVLVVASKLMYVKVDERMEKIDEALPGANCGVCGYGGCSGYAAALVKGKPGEIALGLCRPGGEAVAKQLGDILGVESFDGPVKKIAIVRCIGDSESRSDKMDYQGITTCLAADQMYGGPSACSFGCLGFGDCASVCPKSAICITDGGARVDVRKCIGCEKCVAACPRGVITVLDAPIRAAVLCRNTEKGAVVRKKCTKGCLACSKCVRECPAEAITVCDNLAIIDNAKCNGCGHCAQVCMTKCIAAY